jgi:hypothetical protein
MVTVDMAPLLVCALLTSTLEASSVWQTAEAVAGANNEGGGNGNVQRHLKHGALPRLADSPRAATTVVSGKRQVPGGSNPIHNPNNPPRY